MKRAEIDGNRNSQIEKINKAKSNKIKLLPRHIKRKKKTITDQE